MRPQLSNWEVVTLSSINGFSSVVGTFANGLLFYSTYFNRNSFNREITIRLLVSLSVADFLMCSIVQPTAIYIVNSGQELQKMGALLVLLQILMMASLNGLICVTIDRYIAVSRPLRYIVWMSETRVYIMISASWCIAVLWGILGTTAITLLCYSQLRYSVPMSTESPADKKKRFPPECCLSSGWPVTSRCDQSELSSVRLYCVFYHSYCHLFLFLRFLQQ